MSNTSNNDKERVEELDIDEEFSIVQWNDGEMKTVGELTVQELVRIIQRVAEFYGGELEGFKRAPLGPPGNPVLQDVDGDSAELLSLKRKARAVEGDLRDLIAKIHAIAGEELQNLAAKNDVNEVVAKRMKLLAGLQRGG